MAKAPSSPPAPAQAHPMPETGGHFRRDPVTGALTEVAPALPDDAPKPAPATGEEK